jgi:hypothetical protein
MCLIFWEQKSRSEYFSNILVGHITQSNKKSLEKNDFTKVANFLLEKPYLMSQKKFLKNN